MIFLNKVNCCDSYMHWMHNVCFSKNLPIWSPSLIHVHMSLAVSVYRNKWLAVESCSVTGACLLVDTLLGIHISLLIYELLPIGINLIIKNKFVFVFKIKLFFIFGHFPSPTINHKVNDRGCILLSKRNKIKIKALVPPALGCEEYLISKAMVILSWIWNVSQIIMSMTGKYFHLK